MVSSASHPSPVTADNATLDAANSKGVLSVTRGGSVGLYTIVFGTAAQLDAYVKFLGMDVTVQNSTGVPLTPGYGLKTNSIADPAQALLVFQLLNAAGAAAEAANLDTLYLQFEFSDGS